MAGLISGRVILLFHLEEDSFVIRSVLTEDKFTDWHLSIFCPSSGRCPHLHQPVQIHQSHQIYHIYAALEPPSRSIHVNCQFSLSLGCVWFEILDDADMLPESLFCHSRLLSPPQDL